MDVHTPKPRSFEGEDSPPRPGRSGSKTNESRFVRCKFCSSLNDTEIRSRGDGYNGNISYPTMTGGGNQRNETVGGSGCNFCGSSNGW